MREYCLHLLHLTSFQFSPRGIMYHHYIKQFDGHTVIITVSINRSYKPMRNTDAGGITAMLLIIKDRI